MLGTIMKYIDAFLPLLDSVWQRTICWGPAGDLLDAQRSFVVNRIQSLMSYLTTEADHHEQQLMDSIHANQPSGDKMMKVLAQPSSVEVDDNTPLLQHEEKLSQRVKELTALCDDRLAQLRQLQATEQQQLCITV